MAYTTPSTVAAGQKLTAADYNTYVINNIIALAEDTPAWRYIARTSSDFDKSTDTTLEDVSGLSFSIAASEVWAFEVFGMVSANINGDLKLAVTVPSGATGWYAVPDHHAGNGTYGTTTFGSGIEFQVGQTSGLELFRLNALVINSTTAGTVQVQAAQQTSSATATSVKSGTVIIANRLT